MKPPLKNGRLIPPKSLHQALLDQAQIPVEVAKIEAQLADVGRLARFPTVAEYDRWVISAKAALVLYRSAARQLAQWIEVRERPTDLFREAYDLLNKLEIEVVFEPAETALMARLDEHFGTKMRRVG